MGQPKQKRDNYQIHKHSIASKREVLFFFVDPVPSRASNSSKTWFGAVRSFKIFIRSLPELIGSAWCYSVAAVSQSLNTRNGNAWVRDSAVHAKSDSAVHAKKISPILAENYRYTRETDPSHTREKELSHTPGKTCVATTCWMTTCRQRLKWEWWINKRLN